MNLLLIGILIYVLVQLLIVFLVLTALTEQRAPRHALA